MFDEVDADVVDNRSRNWILVVTDVVFDTVDISKYNMSILFVDSDDVV